MNKVLIVPDVHGRKFWHKAEEMINEVDLVIFLGDYLDPYPHEGITFEESIEEFKLILNFKEKYSDKVVLLAGNHDMHYISLQFMNCSRLNKAKRVELNELYSENIDKFRLAYLLNNKYLFSHAGIYTEWLKVHNIQEEELFIPLEDFLEKYKMALEDVSYVRGGLDNVGSCIWADIRESLSNESLPLMQIVGHTQMESRPYITTKIACLDVRRCFVLDLKTDKFMEFDA